MELAHDGGREREEAARVEREGKVRRGKRAPILPKQESAQRGMALAALGSRERVTCRTAAQCVDSSVGMIQLIDQKVVASGSLSCKDSLMTSRQRVFHRTKRFSELDRQRAAPIDINTVDAVSS